MAKKKLKDQPAKKKSFIEELWATIKILPQAILFVMIINGIAIASFVVPTGSMKDTVKIGDFLFVNKFKYGPSTPQVIPIVNIPLPYYKFPGFWKPEVNDVIVFVFPGNADQIEASNFTYYLKRCVATAGDTIEVRDQQVYVNGKIMKNPENSIINDRNPQLARFPFGTRWTYDNYGPLRIPAKGDVIKLDRYTIPKWRVFIEREGHEVTTDFNSVIIDGKEVTEYTVERDYCFGMGDNRDRSDDSRNFGFIPQENVVGTPMVVYWSWDTDIPMIANIGDRLASIRWGRLGTIIK